MVFVPIYIVILGVTIVVDYFAGLLIEKSPDRKRFYLIASLIANIGALAIFKYYNFFIGNVNELLLSAGFASSLPLLSILLPVGLSFHTFQAMSYIIEVYRGNQKAERHFGIYALYVMFFPQLVAGPIERPQNMLHQFHEEHKFDYDAVVSGLKQILWGLFKKIVIADRLALYVNSVYDNSQNHSGLTLIVATIFFSVQIYCDFSGYSDIALGSAGVLGYKLMTNFNRPYFATGIQEFWGRWHISLSTWFRDYLYIPLGGNRVSKSRWYWNLLIVFLVSGLWHGANWTYIVWGGLHGFYLICGLLLSPFNRRLVAFPYIGRVLSTVITLILVAFAWVFFRATSLIDAFSIVWSILTFKPGAFFIGNPSTLVFSLIGIFVLFCVEFKQEFMPKSFLLLYNERKLVRHITYALLLLGIILFGVFDGGQFIYFQF
jgi:alginate O-acetyltransferase complex protein AlgI